MLKNSPAELAYQRAYNARPENIKKREMNNNARRHAMAAGKVHVGDGKDVDHIRPLEDGGGNRESNLRVVSQHENRSWRKGSGSYDPGKQKK